MNVRELTTIAKQGELYQEEPIIQHSIIL